MGRASRPTVLLHGFTGSAEAWEGVVEALGRAGLAPLCLDLPGHGRAGAADPGPFTLRAALESISAAGRWPADLVGYSMGGRIALHFAAAFPDRVRRLVLESASPGLETAAERAERRASDEALARRLTEEGVRSFVDAWEALPLFESQRRLEPAVRERQRARRLGNDPAALAAAIRGLGTGALPSLWDRLPAIEAPALLLVGADDPKFEDIARRMARRMPRARVRVVADAGHAVHLERPEAWTDAVTTFLGS